MWNNALWCDRKHPEKVVRVIGAGMTNIVHTLVTREASDG